MKPEVGIMPYSYRMTWSWRVLYSAQYHRQHCTLHKFKQFGARDNVDDIYFNTAKGMAHILDIIFTLRLYNIMERMI